MNLCAFMQLLHITILETNLVTNIMSSKSSLRRVLVFRTLCVPCIGSFNKKHQLTVEDMETHTITKDQVRANLRLN